MRTLNEVLHFKGNWRTYQARVLKNADSYLKDGHIHIVAAPGSGKTTLGIELLGRISKPVLILAPSITIREQWKERIVSAFLDPNENPDEWISQSLKNPAPITIATYQALHSAMIRFRGTLDDMKSGDEDDSENSDDLIVHEEQVDFSGFNLVDMMTAAGTQVLLLDECHHLRSEWWKALEEYKSSMSKVNGSQTVIALTATPPYDSNLTSWNRYISMCGEIDEEITVPELVKEGSLCPHQDFVYFNYPTKEELSIVDEYKKKSSELVSEITKNMLFVQAVKGHKVFTGAKSIEEMLDNPSYLSSLIIFMQAKGFEVPNRIKEVMGVRNYPELDEYWLQILLNNFIGASGEDFACDESFRNHIRDELRRKGLVEKGKVTLTMNTSIEKMLVSSKGKLQSILEISESEFNSLGDDLRLLVLTDFIRRDYEKVLGSNDNLPDALGVLPFFESLRNRFNSRGTNAPKLAVLCGTIVIIPGNACEQLLQISGDNSTKLQFTSVGHISESEYVKVSASGSANFLTGAVTELFNQGYINILIGTKSLLGEGWDSPCINSLILASFVGSFMLSNQMRGRAIRVMKDNPNKTSNIWHLVCVKPKSVINKEKKETKTDVADSDDWITLERRMQHFMGLNYSEDVIENGIERLTCIQKPFTPQNVKKTNEMMIQESSKRSDLLTRWNKALEIANTIEVTDETEVSENMVTAAVFIDTLRKIILAIIIYGISYIPVYVTGGLLNKAFAIAGAVLMLYLLTKFPKLLELGSPYRRMKAMGKGILRAMKDLGHLNSDETYKVESMAITGNAAFAIYLKGGSSRDKALFAKCVAETFGTVDNQRYLLCNPKRKTGTTAYYCVPEIMANNKENATKFLKCLEPTIGKYDLVYTRNAEGRKILMKARANAYANIQERLKTHKRVKSALE